MRLVISLMALFSIVICLFNLNRSMELIPLVLLAFGLGIRHAFDPDHLALIDNAIRILVGKNNRSKPELSGFYFSFGHASVVLIFTVIGGIGGSVLQEHLASLEGFGSLFGPLVSSFFILAICLVNIIFLLQTLSKLKSKDSENSPNKPHFHGLFSKIFAKKALSLKYSWQLFPIGVVFAFGLDTALSISSLSFGFTKGESASDLTILCALPLAFMTGMCLFDSVNGYFLTKAYSHFRLDDKKKILFTIITISISIVIGLSISIFQLASLQIDFPDLPLDLIGMAMSIIIIAIFLIIKFAKRPSKIYAS